MALLKSRTLIVILGLLLLAAIMWFAGPYFAFAGYQPLASVVGRLVAILILAVGYAVYVQLRQLKSAQSSRQLAEKVV
ncbi:MAG: hypothetical protein ACRET5_13790, partial [Steroidobacteraceae bacterium]